MIPTATSFRSIHSSLTNTFEKLIQIRRASIAMFCIGLVICFGTSVAGLAAVVQKPAMTRLIVKMAKGLTEAQRQDVVSRHNGTPKGSIPKLDLQIVEVPQYAVDAITKELKDDPSVVRVETDHTRKWQGIPSDAL